MVNMSTSDNLRNFDHFQRSRKGCDGLKILISCNLHRSLKSRVIPSLQTKQKTVWVTDPLIDHISSTTYKRLTYLLGFQERSGQLSLIIFYW